MARLEVVHTRRTRAEVVVEAGLPWIVVTRSENAVRHGSRDDDAPEAEAAEARDIAVRVEPSLRARQDQGQHLEPSEGRRRRICCDVRPGADVLLDPPVRDDA